MASRGSAGVKSFESDLDSGNIAGAQSFLSALQQKLPVGNSGGTASAVSSQITQVSNDLKSGNLTAARSDFSQLKLTLAQHKPGSAAPASNSGSSATQTSAASGNALDSSLAALASYNALQQGAFTGAVNLSMPASIPSLSINM
jgi:hypothetical protein